MTNPEYVADDALYLQNDLRYVGFELWQVKSGSIFDNVLVTDDAEYARAFAEKTWGASRDAEKAMFDAAKKKQQEEDDAEARLWLAAEAPNPPATRTSSGTITTTPSPPRMSCERRDCFRTTTTSAPWTTRAELLYETTVASYSHRV